VDPGHLGSCRIRRIGIIDDQGQTLGAVGSPVPFEDRREIRAFARVFGGNRSIVRECHPSLAPRQKEDISILSLHGVSNPSRDVRFSAK
jgi:hypothetical protein